MRNYHELAPLVLRVGIGGIFIFSGIIKLLDTAMVTGLLQGIGFPIPVVWTWILLLSEIVFGLAVVLGIQLKYTTIPLMVIMIVAAYTLLLTAPSMVITPIVFFFGLISLWLSGPGAFGVSRH